MFLTGDTIERRERERERERESIRINKKANLLDPK
jgi:hypothetical protein